MVILPSEQIKNLISAVVFWGMAIIFFSLAKSLEKGKEQKIYFACSILYVLTGMVNVLAAISL